MNVSQTAPSQAAKRRETDRPNPARGSRCLSKLFFRRAIMPNIKSAKKRVKVISAKTLQNKMFKSQLKTTVKKFRAAVEAGDKEAAKTAYAAAVKKMDQAAAKGLLHKNNAAHKKSEFTLLLNKMA